MFKEIEEKIKEEKYQSAEEQLDKLIINEKISEKEQAYALYLIGYINSLWLNRTRNETKARSYLLWNIKSEYPNPNSYTLYAKLEKDETIAINYLKDGLNKFKGNPQIITELIGRVDDSEKEFYIKQIDNENIVNYDLLVRVLEIIINRNEWHRVRKYAELVINNFELSIYQKNFFELLITYSYLFGNEKYEFEFLINKLENIIKTDLDNQLRYSPYLAMIYTYVIAGELKKANLYFDKISLNNSINDFNDGLNTIVDIDLFYIYKKIFDEIFKVYKTDIYRKNKAKALYILYLYKPSEFFSIYRYSKKDMETLEKYFNNYEFNIEVAVALYRMKLHFNTNIGAYEILIKILLKENKIENDFLEICDLFENISSEDLVIINNNVIDLLKSREIILEYNKNLQKFIDELICNLYQFKLYDRVIRLCNNIDERILRDLERNFEIAYSYAEMDEKEKALRLYEHILLKEPNNSSVLNNISIIYEELGYLEEAFKHIKKANEIEKDDIHTNNYDRINKKLENKAIIEKSNENKKIQDVCKNLSSENLENIGYNIILQKKLNNITDEELKKILIRDLKECAYSVLLGQNKSAIILSGSIIEALLIYKIKNIGIEEYDLIGLRNRKSKCIKTIDKMILDELLYVANKLKILSDTNYYLSHFSREYRNVIHPNKEIRGKMEISAENASLMWKILKEIIFELL